MTAAVTRVVVADDHVPTRSDVARMLTEAGGFEVCGLAGDAAGAVAAALRESPDLCLLDVRMPGSGIAAAWEITARLPGTRVVMLTVSEDDFDLFNALRAGASGYLLKDTDGAVLAERLREVLAGDAAVSSGLVTRLVEEFRERGPRRRVLARGIHDGERLTSREWEVLELMRRGLGTADIAGRLHVSQVTVRSHVSAILRKLRAADRDEAVRLIAGR